MTAPAAERFYLDWPGYPVDGPSAPDRVIGALPAAVQAARELYSAGDMEKVIVCRLSDRRRVATILGSRSEPRVIYRRLD